jgi:hypothetical protein
VHLLNAYHDSTTLRFGAATQGFLNGRFPVRWICRGGPATRSSGLIPELLTGGFAKVKSIQTNTARKCELLTE